MPLALLADLGVPPDTRIAMRHAGAHIRVVLDGWRGGAA